MPDSNAQTQRHLVPIPQVFSDRHGMMGIVDYATREDLKYALRKLDDTEFRNPFEKCYIRVKEDTRGGDERGRSRSRSRSRRCANYTKMF